MIYFVILIKFYVDNLILMLKTDHKISGISDGLANFGYKNHLKVYF